MGLKTFVKIGDISNLSDARYCAGMGVDILGFRIDPQDPARVTPDKFKSITEWVSGVDLAGEFYASSLSEIRESAAGYALDYLQVNQWDYPEALADLELPVIMETTIDENTDVQSLAAQMAYHKPWVAFYIISSSSEASCQKFLNEIASEEPGVPIILGCGITEENANELVEKAFVKGIALKGSEEIKPGYKDYEELAGILESLEVE